ncbi:MAG: amidohydrolase family protein [Gammaproteobacteria bacterium]
MNRRSFVGVGGAGVVACLPPWPDGFLNECIDGGVPEDLLQHDLVRSAWEEIDPAQFWDCHVHLIGQGDGASGAWVNPQMRSLLNPLQYLQYRFYLNAACADPDTANLDRAYVQRLVKLKRALRPGARLMLLAFDYTYDTDGRRLPELTAFHIPNAYAQAVAAEYRDDLEWIASIHPYREDAVEALGASIEAGARAIKWLPPAMGIDPAAPQCDRLYTAMAAANIPLLVHAGEEKAVHGPARQEYGNPLRMRRALEHGVRVIVAHCASLGTGDDYDNAGARASNFALFARLMDDVRYEKLLFGDISAMTQFNRLYEPFEAILAREEWHARLINGSDYPLPGVVPLFSLGGMVERGYFSQVDADVLAEIRRYNPLLFDLVVKRSIRHRDKRLPARVFMTKRHFIGPSVSPAVG